jgi:hypothetical protein
MLATTVIPMLVLVALLALTLAPVGQVDAVDALYLCMKNCEQCKSMYGAYFDGDLCAKSCFRQRGQVNIFQIDF